MATSSKNLLHDTAHHGAPSGFVKDGCIQQIIKTLGLCI